MIRDSLLELIEYGLRDDEDITSEQIYFIVQFVSCWLHDEGFHKASKHLEGES